MQGQAPLASAPWGSALVQDYPEIENFVRLEKAELYLKDHCNMFHKQKLIVADNSIFLNRRRVIITQHSKNQKQQSSHVNMR